MAEAQRASGTQTSPTPFLTIWNMSFGFLGIQFGWALQMANMSAIYEYLGATRGSDPDALARGAAHRPHRPADHRSRERPHLVAAPRPPASVLPRRRDPQLDRAARHADVERAVDGRGSAVDPRRVDQHHHGAVPGVRRRPAARRAERTRGFAMQSLFIGLGAVIASAMPWMLTNWFGVGPSTPGTIPTTVRLSFFIGSAAFFGAVLWTILTTKEYPPEDLEAFHRRKQQNAGIAASAARDPQGSARDAADDAPARVRAALHVARALLHVALFPGRRRAQRLRRAGPELAAVPAGRRVGGRVLRGVLRGVLRVLVLPAVDRARARPHAARTRSACSPAPPGCSRSRRFTSQDCCCSR